MKGNKIHPRCRPRCLSLSLSLSLSNSFYRESAGCPEIFSGRAYGRGMLRVSFLFFSLSSQSDVITREARESQVEMRVMSQLGKFQRRFFILRVNE